MTLCIDTEKLVRDSVDKSIRDVFSMMIGAELTRIEFETREMSRPEPENIEPSMTVLVGLTGDIQGTLSLSMSDLAAIAWSHALIEHETDKVDQTVVDAIGELGNMVVGGVKRRLAGNNLTMSLPTVIRTSEASLVFPTNTSPIQVQYDFAGYTITFVIAMRNA